MNGAVHSQLSPRKIRVSPNCERTNARTPSSRIPLAAQTLSMRARTEGVACSASDMLASVTFEGTAPKQQNRVGVDVGTFEFAHADIALHAAIQRFATCCRARRWFVWMRRKSIIS